MVKVRTRTEPEYVCDLEPTRWNDENDPHQDSTRPPYTNYPKLYRMTANGEVVWLVTVSTVWDDGTDGVWDWEFYDELESAKSRDSAEFSLSMLADDIWLNVELDTEQKAIDHALSYLTEMPWGEWEEDWSTEQIQAALHEIDRQNMALLKKRTTLQYILEDRGLPTIPPSS